MEGSMNTENLLYEKRILSTHFSKCDGHSRLIFQHYFSFYAHTRELTTPEYALL